MELISTRNKEKLPRDFSYPIGAEALSAALSNVPQYERLEITFVWKDTFRASEYNSKLKAKGDITLLEVRYSERWNEWTIWVHAVAREHAHAARQWLLEQLPKLIAALHATPTEASVFEWKVSYPLSSAVAGMKFGF